MDHLQTTPRSPQSGFPLIVSQRYSGRCRFRFSMLVVVAAAFPWSASSARGQIPKKDAAVSWLHMVPGTVADRYARTLENLGLLPERSAAVRDGSEFWMLSAEEYRTPEGVSSGTPPWHGVCIGLHRQMKSVGVFFPCGRKARSIPHFHFTAVMVPSGTVKALPSLWRVDGSVGGAR